MRLTQLPFLHMVLDGFADAAELVAANAAWPAAGWPGWVAYGESYHAKRASSLADAIPPACADLLRRMAEVPVGWLGFGHGLVPDLGLYGGGLHELLPGQRVGTHLDASHHARLGLSRRLTAILYLSACEGGELELWDDGMQEKMAWIAPMPGRLVLFANGPRSWHSVAPVTGTAPRRSLSLFFYGPPDVDRSRPRAYFVRPFGA